MLSVCLGFLGFIFVFICVEMNLLSEVKILVRWLVDVVKFKLWMKREVVFIFLFVLLLCDSRLLMFSLLLIVFG